jgi:hypothetical protein
MIMQTFACPSPWSGLAGGAGLPVAAGMLRVGRAASTMTEVPCGPRNDQRNLGRATSINTPPAMHHTLRHERRPLRTLTLMGGAVLRFVQPLMFPASRTSTRPTTHQTRSHPTRTRPGSDTQRAACPGGHDGSSTGTVSLFRITASHRRIRSTPAAAAVVPRCVRDARLHGVNSCTERGVNSCGSDQQRQGGQRGGAEPEVAHDGAPGRQM